MRFKTPMGSIEGVQYTCSNDRWSNTVNVVHFSGLRFADEIRHVDLPGDPWDRYGLQISIPGFFGILRPGDWLVRENGQFRVMSHEDFAQLAEVAV